MIEQCRTVAFTTVLREQAQEAFFEAVEASFGDVELRFVEHLLGDVSCERNGTSPEVSLCHRIYACALRSFPIEGVGWEYHTLYYLFIQ